MCRTTALHFAARGRSRPFRPGRMQTGDDSMAEHHTGPVETGAPMDYAEHEKTYNLFVNASKYGTMFCVTLLIAMAAGFFTGAGFFSMRTK